jgi:aryl-alcohol dehydrogenase-like predicted oxidoreductase
MSDEPQTKKAKTVEEPAALPVIPRRRIERLGIDVPVLGFPGIALCTDRFADPAEAANLVTSAVERGATYFDVAPLYGDGLAQARLGPALAPHRDKVFLACKTIFRDGEGAEKDLDCSLKACLTTYFDLYQLHSITTKEDVDTALGEGGALEVLKKAKAEGKIKAIGFSAHDEDQALRLIETGEFDTVLFPINFLAWTTGGVGERLVKEATKAGMGILGIKSMARCRITSEDGVEVPQGKMKHMPEDMQKERLKMYANPKVRGQVLRKPFCVSHVCP